MPRLTVNGEPHEVTGVRTVAELLEVMDVSRSNLVVEFNGNVLQPEEYDATVLAEGDALELVRFVGGG